MSRRDRALRRHVDALLRDRRPPRSDAGDDLTAMQMAAQLRAAHAGSAEPSPDFVDALARKLRHQHEEPPVPMPQRRRFLAAAGLAAAAGLGAGFGIERLRETVSGLPATGQQPIVPVDGAWLAVAKLADLTPGAIRRFTAGGVEGVVLRAAGEVRALSAACTDQGCILNPDPAAQRLVCPCHYATFETDGTPTSGTAYAHKVTPLPTISARVNGDDVEVLVPRHP